MIESNDQENIAKGPDGQEKAGGAPSVPSPFMAKPNDPIYGGVLKNSGLTPEKIRGLRDFLNVQGLFLVVMKDGRIEIGADGFELEFSKKIVDFIARMNPPKKNDPS